MGGPRHSAASMALEGSTLLAGLGGKGGPPPAPSGLNSPWLVLNRGPPSAAARSRTSTRRGPPTGGGRRLPSGAGDAPATRAAAAARAAMLQQQRRRKLFQTDPYTFLCLFPKDIKLLIIFTAF